MKKVLSLFALIVIMLVSSFTVPVKENTKDNWVYNLKPVLKLVDPVTVDFCGFGTPCDDYIYYDIGFDASSSPRTLNGFLKFKVPFSIDKTIWIQDPVAAGTSYFRGVRLGIWDCTWTLKTYGFNLSY